MPTFNQLVRKGRQTSVKKSKAPALQTQVQFSAETWCLHSREDCYTEEAEFGSS